MADELQEVADICFVMFDPRLPSRYGALRRAFDGGSFHRWIIRNDDIINNIIDDVFQKVVKLGKLSRKAAMKFFYSQGSDISFVRS